MFYSYIKLALRHMRRDKFYATINIVGLAIGLAFAITVLSNIVFEHSFENFHANKDRIYRVDGQYTYEQNGKSIAQNYAGHLAPLGQAIVDEVPGVAASATFRSFRRLILNTNGQDYRAGELFAATPDYFKLFNFPLLEGDGALALKQPSAILISESARDKYFPKMDPIGEVITFKDIVTGSTGGREHPTDFTGRVVGVLKDMPDNTQLTCEFIISTASLKGLGIDMDDWESATVSSRSYTFLLLEEGTEPAFVAAQITGVLTKHLGSEVAAQFNSGLRPLREMHFAGNNLRMWDDLRKSTTYGRMIFTGTMALILLAISIFNFINLSTARYATRQHEVGVRKVLGARRKNLIMQFLGESIVYTVFALLLGLSIHELTSNAAFGIYEGATVSLFQSPALLLAVLGLGIVVSFVAGIYPSLYLSRLNPVTIFQDRGGLGKSKLRKTLVTFQFTVAIILIAASVMNVRHMEKVLNYNYGFERENIVVHNFEGEHADAEIRAMKDEVVRIPGVVAVTSAISPPGLSSPLYYRFTTGGEDGGVIGRLYNGDENYEQFFDLKLTAGSYLGQSDVPSEEAVLITEATVRNLKLDNPVGAYIYAEDDGKQLRFQVVGVIEKFKGILKGFGYENAHLIRIHPDQHITLSIKLDNEDIPATLAAIKTVWDRTMPGRIYNQYFLDEVYSDFIDGFLSGRDLMVTLAGLTVGIASLGILGLVSFTARSKTKEIGIRKVLGASVNAIIWLLSKEFTRLLIIANIVAWPIAYIWVGEMSGGLVTGVSMGLGTFFLVTSATIFIALGSTIFQARKAATANPVDSLRYE